MKAQLVNEYINLLNRYGLKTISEEVKLAGKVSELIYGADLKKFASASPQDDYEMLKPPPDIVRQRLKSLNVSDNVFMLEMLQRYSSQIEAAISFDEKTLPMQVYCGFFPTGSFNAQAVKVKNGALLLLNQGLFMLVHRVIRLMSYVEGFDIFTEPNEVKQFKESLAYREIMSEEQIIKNMADLIIYYLTFKNPLASPRVKRQKSPTVNAFLGVHVEAVEMFALAHEYAHVMLGHLTQERNILVNTPAGDLEVYQKSRDQEFDADQIAIFNILHADLHLRSISEKQDDGRILLDTVAFVSAPFIFFMIDDLVNAVAQKLSRRTSIPLVSTHPPSQERIGAIYQDYMSVMKQIEDKAGLQPDQLELIQRNMALKLEPALWSMGWFLKTQEAILEYIEHIQSKR